MQTLNSALGISKALASLALLLLMQMLLESRPVVHVLHAAITLGARPYGSNTANYVEMAHMLQSQILTQQHRLLSITYLQQHYKHAFQNWAPLVHTHWCEPPIPSSPPQPPLSAIWASNRLLVLSRSYMPWYM